LIYRKIRNDKHNNLHQIQSWIVGGINSSYKNWPHGGFAKEGSGFFGESKTNEKICLMINSYEKNYLDDIHENELNVRIYM